MIEKIDISNGPLELFVYNCEKCGNMISTMLTRKEMDNWREYIAINCHNCDNKIGVENI